MGDVDYIKLFKDALETYDYECALSIFKNPAIVELLFNGTNYKDTEQFCERWEFYLINTNKEKWTDVLNLMHFQREMSRMRHIRGYWLATVNRGIDVNELANYMCPVKDSDYYILPTILQHRYSRLGYNFNITRGDPLPSNHDEYQRFTQIESKDITVTTPSKKTITVPGTIYFKLISDYEGKVNLDSIAIAPSNFVLAALYGNPPPDENTLEKLFNPKVLYLERLEEKIRDIIETNSTIEDSKKQKMATALTEAIKATKKCNYDPKIVTDICVKLKVSLKAIYPNISTLINNFVLAALYDTPSPDENTLEKLFNPKVFYLERLEKEIRNIIETNIAIEGGGSEKRAITIALTKAIKDAKDSGYDPAKLEVIAAKLKERINEISIIAYNRLPQNQFSEQTLSLSETAPQTLKIATASETPQQSYFTRNVEEIYQLMESNDLENVEAAISRANMLQKELNETVKKNMDSLTRKRWERIQGKIRFLEIMDIKNKATLDASVSSLLENPGFRAKSMSDRNRVIIHNITSDDVLSAFGSALHSRNFQGALDILRYYPVAKKLIEDPKKIQENIGELVKMSNQLMDDFIKQGGATLKEWNSVIELLERLSSTRWRWNGVNYAKRMTEKQLGYLEWAINHVKCMKNDKSDLTPPPSLLEAETSYDKMLRSVTPESQPSAPNTVKEQPIDSKSTSTSSSPVLPAQSPKFSPIGADNPLLPTPSPNNISNETQKTYNDDTPNSNALTKVTDTPVHS